MSFAPPRNRLVTAGWIALLALLTWFAFAPVLTAEFVNWDDGANIVENQAFRGFSAEHLRWMFTTTHLGPYQPLAWCSLACDHAAGGLDATVFHRTNLVLHIVGAITLFFLARRLFTILAGARLGPLALDATSFAAAALFAVHPLRCESVCWVTERRDVLNAPFFFASAYFWLGYVTAERGQGRRAYFLALACMLFSLLAKATTVVTPFVFLLFDLWPLRDQARARGIRTVLLEKVPFLTLAIVFGVVALIGQARDAVMISGDVHGLTTRVIQAGYAALFYVARSIWPVDLVPIHALPPLEAFFGAELFLPALVTLLVSVAAVIRFRRAPGLATTWFAYLVLLALVSGLVQAGPQLVADRYSYIACVPFALLAAVGFGKLALRSKPAAILSFAIVTAALVARTREQSGVWHDSEHLWNHTLAIDPRNAIALGNLAVFELEAGQAAKDPRRALELLHRSNDHGERAVAVRAEPRWLFNLAAARFQLAQRERERRTEHIIVAVDSARAGRDAALALKRPVEARWSVIQALALYDQNRFAEALPIAEEARAGLPGDAEVARLAASLRMECGRVEDAVSLLEETLRAAPDNSLLWYDLARAFERAGDATRSQGAARSGRTAAERQLGARASELPWYAELVRRSG